MRLRHIGFSFVVLGLAVGASPARAQESRDDKFSAWDRNRDGRLEMGEMQANQANFRAMDCNHDGYLSREEFTNRYQCDDNNANATAPAPAPAAVLPAEDDYARLDQNRDGVVSRVEWTRSDNFRRYDRDNDGVVTRDEYRNPVDPNAPEGRFVDEDLNRDGVISRGEWRSSRGAFDALDVDRDGVLTAAEYSRIGSANLGTWQARFDALDRNHDGTVSRFEWRGETASFGTADLNNDNVVSREEYATLYGGGTDPGSYARNARFDVLDRNHNGEVARGEWRGESISFDAVDRNRDNHVTRDEYLGMGTGSASDSTELRFRTLDRNHNGYLSTSEYRGESVPFRTADRDRDDRISLEEYASLSQSGAYSDARDQRFRELDRNNDGLLTSYEWRGENVPFATADRNNDRTVTRDEYLAATGYAGTDPYRRVAYDPRTERFNLEDRNRDGRIARSEWQGERGAFDVLDADRDGYVSNAEYRDRSRLVGVFTGWDSNRDGVLTREEFRYGQPLFDRLDVNRDGVLSRDEFLAM
jgi:Ca2+-binding EF-hand superfamily protein